MKRCFRNHQHWESPPQVDKDLQLQGKFFRDIIAKVNELPIRGNYLQCGWKNNDGSISLQDHIYAVSGNESTIVDIRTLKGMINNRFYLFLVYLFCPKLINPSCACFDSMSKGMLRMRKFVLNPFKNLIDNLQKILKSMFIANLQSRQRLENALNGLEEMNAFIRLEQILDFVNELDNMNLKDGFGRVIRKFYSTEISLKGDESDGTFKHTEYIALFDLMKRKKLRDISNLVLISHKDICDTCTSGLSILWFENVYALTFQSCNRNHFF